MSNDESEDEMFPVDVRTPRIVPFVYNDPSLLTGVLRAVVESDLDKLKTLVASGKSLNINDNNGNTALHFAVAKNHLEMLEYILDQEGVQIDARNEFEETPIGVASSRGYYEATKMLIDKGADVNCEDKSGATPLHNSVFYPDIIELLLSKGADVDHPDLASNTPLHIAVEKQCLQTVYVLLYYNADVNAVNKFEYNAFMKALLNNNTEIQEILLDYVADFNVTNTLYLALRNHSPFYEEIVRRGAEVDFLAFKACIELPNVKKFKFVWNNLKRIDIDVSKKRVFLNLFTLWNRKMISPYVNVMLEYSNGEVLQELGVEEFSYDFHYIINEYKDTLSYEQISKITFLFLQFGMKLTTSVIVSIFSCYGMCELFRSLLHMDFVGKWPNAAITPIMVFDVQVDLEKLYREIYQDMSVGHWQWDMEDLRLFICYWTHEPLLQLLSNAFRGYLFSNHPGPPKVPSLLQLARDETRKYITGKFKMERPSQYYTYVNHLDISMEYKSILKYERTLYDIPSHIFKFV